MTNDITKYTEIFIKKLPHWFSERKGNTNTNLVDLLEVMNLSLTELERILNYIETEINLIDANEDELNYVYKGFLPTSITKEDELTIVSENEILKLINTSKDFIKSSNESFKFIELSFDNPAYIDYSNNHIYVKTKNETIQILVSSDDKEDETFEVNLNQHKIFNLFDEFGYYVGLKRNEDESNREYKKRLLNLFKIKPSSNGVGLCNALAVELGLVTELEWEDGSTDLIIKDTMIIYNLIKIDDEYINKDNIKITTKGHIVLLGNKEFENISRTVSYMSNIELHELNNLNDISMTNRMHNIDNEATEFKKKLSTEINNNIPLLFAHNKVGVSRWDLGIVENTDKGSLGYSSDIATNDFLKFGVVENNLVDNSGDDYKINLWSDINDIGTWSDVKNQLPTWKDVLISRR